MTSPINAEASQAVRKWLSRLARSGGIAARLALALPVVSGGLLIVQAGVLAHALHLAIVDGVDPARVSAPVGLFAGVLALRIALGFAGDLSAAASSESVKLDLRGRLVAALLARPPSWTASRSGGALSSIIVEQVEAMDGYLTRYLPAMAQAALLPIAFVVVVLPIDWMVALLFIVTVPLIPVFMALAGWGAEAASQRQASALSRLSGYFADRLRGLTTLKLFGREAAEIDGVGRASEELRGRTMRVMRIAFLSSAILEFFAALGVAGVALYVGLTFLHLVVLRGTPLTLEAGLFCLLMAPEVYQPLRLLAANYHDQAAAKAAVKEIASQFDELPEPALAATAVQSAPATGRSGAIAVFSSGVSVNAPDGRSIICDADFTVASGERVAIIGESGNGKSTLLEALAGLRPYAGSIRLDGRELAHFEPTLLRAGVAVLGQRPSIFAGSIAENIRLGRAGACDTAVEIAARRARVLDFTRELPLGLETMLGEDGIGLSGGEIHRVALARVYLRDPGLLLLDEPTAHLDATTEARVIDGLLDFARGRTLVIVTHASAVAARMDRCLNIAGGQVLPALRPEGRSLPQRGAA